MTDTIHGDFKFTMSGLEKGLKVAHITTSSLQGCDIDDNIGDVMNNEQLLPFDLWPVRQNGQIVGAIRRREVEYPSSGIVRDCIHHLDESVLISAEMPLLEYISIDPLDRLVLQGINICGIVTRSDLLKLPVRLLAFSLVTHIEVLMSNLICISGVQEQAWLTYLPNRRSKDITEKQQKLKLKHSDPDMLEHTYFSDKRVILEHLFHSKETVIHELLREEAIDQLKEINELRNTVAHTGKDIESKDPIQDFIERLRLTQAWINNFQGILAKQGEREVI
jgi:hypothetical protein